MSKLDRAIMAVIMTIGAGASMVSGYYGCWSGDIPADQPPITAQDRAILDVAHALDIGPGDKAALSSVVDLVQHGYLDVARVPRPIGGGPYTHFEWEMHFRVPASDSTLVFANPGDATPFAKVRAINVDNLKESIWSEWSNDTGAWSEWSDVLEVAR